eukprot:CAMPEP_0197643618 /NCGR_PEP_ID=MMETSP1338-20131121/16873_1 /TAXON_ID=43686 ORGANISM="Pelagodinium beii, Strain RCC1491" /NCGR_SAMPLE_ID=MMETSP1338 /ASSEMBLY_ACC=CAM_ASM_000754 /LENGTH=181 /DNA_ID=CAMNT_0043216891 /DNA_START=14 /DNA_END=556 /DNA_ORIENTATION=-
MTLEDDSRMVMTADHPVRVSQGKLTRHSVLPAHDLLPGVHFLQCFRLVDLKVKSVRQVGGTGGKMVALSVQQGQRYHVLVAGPDSASAFTSSMALGSADLSCHGWSAVGSLEVTEEVCDDSNFLPASCQVLVENMEEAQTLSSVHSGHKVLCLDTLTSEQKYVEVESMRISTFTGGENLLL